MLKTGTTCIGIKLKDGVILAADKRVTTYMVESDKFTKVFDLTKNIAMTVSGHVSPAQLFVRHLKAELKLMELKNERPVRVREAALLLSSWQMSSASGGMIVGSIMGGFDSKEGAGLFELSPDGSVIDVEDYYTNGSGSIFTQSILDSEFKKTMSEKEALDLLDKCFRASFKKDTASGGGYIARIITKDGIKEVTRKVVKTELVAE